MQLVTATVVISDSGCNDDFDSLYLILLPLLTQFLIFCFKNWTSIRNHENRQLGYGILGSSRLCLIFCCCTSQALHNLLVSFLLSPFLNFIFLKHCSSVIICLQLSAVSTDIILSCVCDGKVRTRDLLQF